MAGHIRRAHVAGGAGLCHFPVGSALAGGALFFYSAIANATKRIWIASPYFVPDRGVLTALEPAALEGLDVRILLPEVVEQMLAADFTRAYQLEKPLAAQPRMVRFGAPVPRLFAPIL